MHLKGYEKYTRVSRHGAADAQDCADDTDGPDSGDVPRVRVREPFCLKRFQELLVRWIAADDQVSS